MPRLDLTNNEVQTLLCREIEEIRFHLRIAEQEALACLPNTEAAISKVLTHLSRAKQLQAYIKKG